jgi:trehalose-6-phosphate synthase
MVAVHLAKLAPQLRVLVVERKGAPGPGIAYSAESVHQLLNVPAGKMSAFADEPGHFVTWLKAHRDELTPPDIEIEPTAFLPRQFYGRYVQDVFEQAREAAGIETAETEIVDIEPGAEHQILIDRNGGTFAAKKVVLAVGNFPPGDPPTRDRSFHRSERYLSSPWSAETLKALKQRDDILILGAGLTALDLLVALNARKAEGMVYVVSRRGLFPQPHKAYEPKPEWFSGREFPNTVRSLLKLIRDEVQTASNEGIDWRAIVDALRPHTQRIWKSLNMAERRRFLRHLRPFWESHRHRSAPAVLDVKERMVAGAQVVSLRAHVTGIIEGPDWLEVTLFDRVKKQQVKFRVAYVVNCTGPECNYYKLKAPLVVNLLARGLIHPDPLYLGLATASNGALLNYLGTPSETLFTLGSVMRGMLFETTAVPELRVQARELAEELIRPAVRVVRGPRGRRADMSGGNIVLISNRGPNDFVWQDDRWIPRGAAGGLVSMIEPLARQPDVSWFCCVSEPPSASEARAALYTTAADQADPEHHIVPVPLPSRIYQAHYGAISNEVLWMLQHHLVGQFGYSSLDAERHRAWQEGYLEANRRMVVAIRASGIKPRAFLIQDYHFYPLPALLRQVFPEVPSLHFTHIPFPDSATLKLIPHHWREAILNGLLGADVVGMQTQWDTRPFLGCCEELLGATVNYEAGTVISADGRLVRVQAFPASTDPAAVQATMRSELVARARERLARYLDKFSIIRVDRLDPSKNQIIGFQAFGRLLEMRPDLRGSVRFLAFLVPSRTDLSVYREYRDAVYAAIAEVNRRFAGECGFDPIEVFYTHDREQALAAMEQCDVLLVNSREDGMNLVVKEWAVVSERPGVSVVSETSGVAAEAGPSALLISPLDIEGTARSLEWALDMPTAERQARLARLRAKINSWTSANWLNAQLEALNLKASDSEMMFKSSAASRR